MSDPAEIDVAVLGGGIAGLWLLARLRAMGFDAILFDSKALGSGQTLASQGILHSGVKYAFDAAASSPAESLAAMPKLWMDCIAGAGEVDLRGTEILAPNQCVFTSGGLGGKLAGAVASKAFRSAFEALERGEFPEVFCGASFKGEVFRLQEPVIAVRTALAALAERARPAVCAAKVRELRGEGGVDEILFDDAAQTRVRPRACFFTAGEGNEWFAGRLGLRHAAQRRPLRMFMARGLPHRAYAHWLDANPKPRLTITTHDLAGENIWYVGGRLAEKTVGQDAAKSLRHAHAELSAAFPEMDWNAARWAIHDVDRAEPAANQLLPKGPTLTTVGNAALAWPTKLALAPALAGQALRWLAERGVSPSNKKTELALPPAAPGRYPWEEAREWTRA